MNTGLEGFRRRYDTAVFERHELSNGIPLWLQKPPILTDEEGIFIAFLPRVGSRLDPPGGHGVAHFFEHTPYRGTRTKPSKLELMRPIEAWGGDIQGAATALEWTRYPVRLPKDVFPLGVETVCEMVTDPLFREEDVDAEREVILKEHGDLKKDQYKIIVRSLLRHLFGEHPLNHLPIGDPGSIARVDAGTLADFHRRHYHAGNLAFICGGGFAEREDILAVTDGVFGRLRRETPAAPGGGPPPIRSGGRIEVVDADCVRDALWLAYPMAPLAEGEHDQLAFLASILGNNLTSPLMIEFREKHAIAYSGVACELFSLSDVWVFLVRIPVEAKHFARAGDLYRSVLRDLDATYVAGREREYQYARKLSFQSAVSACMAAVNEVVMTGTVRPWHEAEAMQDSFTLDEIFRWRDWLRDTEPFTLQIRTA